MQDLSTYAFINAKVRAMLGLSLSAEDFNRLIQARDIEDAIVLLKDTPYAAFVRVDVLHDKDLEFIERELEAYDISLHQKILRGLSMDGALKKIIILLKERYELDQVKVRLRAWNKKAGDEGRPIAARNVDELAGEFSNTPFSEPILAGKEKYQKTGSLFYIEAALDRDYFDRLWRAIDRLPRQDREIAKRMVGVEIDIENISGLSRLKQYYDLPSGEVASMMLPRGYKTNQQLLQAASQGFTKGLYDDLAQASFQEAQRVLAGFPFTIGTILGYLILKRLETRNIISILYSKSYGMKPDQIRGILVC